MNNETGKKTVALYARVSTMDQSCDMQLEDLRRYASRFARSFEYVEVGVSGAQRRRPQLDQLMKDARKRHLVAHALDVPVSRVRRALAPSPTQLPSVPTN